MNYIIYAISITIVLVTLTIIIFYKPKRQTSKHYDHTITTGDTVTQIMKIYQRSGINLPLDIIEELNHNDQLTLDEAIKYTETLRTHWKYECMKKLYKP